MTRGGVAADVFEGSARLGDSLSLRICYGRVYGRVAARAAADRPPGGRFVTVGATIDLTAITGPSSDNHRR